jgi:multidrug efflux pump subunit AcrA (membrane-fusion protein)
VLGQVEGLIEFTDPQQRYPAGAFVTATFTKGEAKTVLVVPESALLIAADGSYVYTINGSRLIRTPIKPGVAIFRIWPDYVSSPNNQDCYWLGLRTAGLK